MEFHEHLCRQHLLARRRHLTRSRARLGPQKSALTDQVVPVATDASASKAELSEADAGRPGEAKSSQFLHRWDRVTSSCLFIAAFPRVAFLDVCLGASSFSRSPRLRGASSFLLPLDASGAQLAIHAAMPTARRARSHRLHTMQSELSRFIGKPQAPHWSWPPRRTPGNHDYQRDPCICTDDISQCAQVNADEHNRDFFFMPNYTYYKGLPHMDLEIIAMDSNQFMEGWNHSITREEPESYHSPSDAHPLVSQLSMRDCLVTHRYCAHRQTTHERARRGGRNDRTTGVSDDSMPTEVVGSEVDALAMIVRPRPLYQLSVA